MKKLVIVSEKTRGHFQSGITLLKGFEVVHFYKDTFSDMVINESDPNFVRYSGVVDLYRKLKQQKPDLVQPLEPYYGYSRFRLPIKVLPIMFTTYYYCRANKVPYFVHFLENITPRVKYGWPFYLIMQKIGTMITGGASLLFWVNQGAKKNIELLGGGKKSKFGLWGIWGVDPAKYKPVEDFDPSLILFVGRVTAQKGVFDLIEVMKLVSRQNPSAKLKIVGTGDADEQVGAIISSQGLEDKVSLVGEVPDDQVVKYYQQAAIVVVPSKTLRYSAEQVGMVIIEAMACGKPVVAYNSGSINEFVKNLETGFVVRESDVVGMANQIVRLLGDKQIYKPMSEKSRQEAKARFDQRKNVVQLEEEITRLVSCR